MSTDRLSLRAVLALLLAGSAILFFIGISLERGTAASTSPARVEASAEPASAEPAEGSSSGANEAGHSPAATAESTGETAGEHAAETWPLGIDLETPALVGGVIVGSIVLAVAVMVTTNPIIPMAIVGFAVLFGLFDLLELVHQLGRGQNGLAVIGLALLVAHAAAGIIALRLLTQRNLAMPSIV